MLLAIALSLLAALLFAVASVLQQRGTSTIADDDALGAGMLASLLRRPVWLAGIAADVAGFGVPSDVFSRYMRMAGHDVLMVSGTDEHGTTGRHA